MVHNRKNSGLKKLNLDYHIISKLSNLFRLIRISNEDVEAESCGKAIRIRIRNRREQIRHRNIPKQSRPNHLHSRLSNRIFVRFRNKPSK